MMAGLCWPAGSTVEQWDSRIDNRVLSHFALPIVQCNIRIHILLMETLREYFFLSVNRLLLNKTKTRNF